MAGGLKVHASTAGGVEENRDQLITRIGRNKRGFLTAKMRFLCSMIADELE
jgi:hypothetical protein